MQTPHLTFIYRAVRSFLILREDRVEAGSLRHRRVCTAGFKTLDFT